MRESLILMALLFVVLAVAGSALFGGGVVGSYLAVMSLPHPYRPVAGDCPVPSRVVFR